MWARGDLRVPPAGPYGEPWETRRPRKRFRHRRRYYRRLAGLAERFAPGGAEEGSLDWNGWFDLWHTHADRDGYGNRGGRDRRRHLAASLELLRVFRRRAESAARPMQVFWLIHPADSSQDGVYVHTPNPNADNFPAGFTGVAWDVPAPPILRDLVPADEWQIGRSPGDAVWPPYYLVRPRERAADRRRVASNPGKEGLTRTAREAGRSCESGITSRRRRAAGSPRRRHRRARSRSAAFPPERRAAPPRSIGLPPCSRSSAAARFRRWSFPSRS
jgi:hypothetical protein